METLIPPPSCWFSFNSETIKVVTLEFCRIQQNFIKDIRAKFRIRNSPQSPDIGQNADSGIIDFRISGQSLMNENCRNSRTSNDTDMKLGPVTKLYKRNTTTSKNLTVTSFQQIVTSLFFLHLWPICSNPHNNISKF